MPAPISRLDHVIIAVKDLASAAKTFERLGFRLTPRGLHEGKGTGNNCIMFANAYVELLGVVDPAQAKGRLATMVADRGEGGIGIAYGADNADETAKSIRATGIAVENPNELSRPLNLDGERMLVRFSNVMLPKLQPAGLLQFVCTHLTPNLTRARHEWNLHASGAIRLTGVTVAAEDINTPLADWQKLFGEERITHGDSVHTVALDNLTLSLMTPQTLETRFGKGVVGLPKLPAVAALTFAVHEPDAASAMLDAAGIPFVESEGRLIVPAKDAHGVAIVLEES